MVVDIILALKTNTVAESDVGAQPPILFYEDSHVKTYIGDLGLTVNKGEQTRTTAGSPYLGGSLPLLQTSLCDLKCA